MYKLMALLSLGGLCSLMACSGNQDAAAASPAAQATANEPYVIHGGTVLELTAGQPLSEAADRLEAGTLVNGEGTFEVYYIHDEAGERLGYLLPSVRDPSRIGNIFLTSPRVATAAGIHVGDPFAKLMIAYPDVELHGSEIEGRTYAQVGAVAFILEGVYNTAYEVDPATVPPNTPIREIMLADQPAPEF